jgi:hypothetical protein
MSRIQLANLPSAGSALFQGSESFLTELQSTEAHAVYGGGSGSGSGKKKKRRGPDVLIINNNNYNNGHGHGCGCP